MSNLDTFNLLLTGKSTPKIQSEKRGGGGATRSVLDSRGNNVNIKGITVVIRRHPWFSNQGVPRVGTNSSTVHLANTKSILNKSILNNSI